MDDLISRQATYDVLTEYYHHRTNTQHEALWDALKRVPSAQPELQWILCSERPPQGQTEVIVSCRDDSGDSKYDYTACGWMTTNGEYWIVDNEINYDVVAWMPFPEPYKGKEN